MATAASRSVARLGASAWVSHANARNSRLSPRLCSLDSLRFAANRDFIAARTDLLNKFTTNSRRGVRALAAENENVSATKQGSQGGAGTVQEIQEKGSFCEIIIRTDVDLEGLKDGDTFYANGCPAVLKARKEDTVVAEMTTAALKDLGAGAWEPGMQLRLDLTPPKMAAPGAQPQLADFDFSASSAPRDVELGFASTKSRKRASKIKESLHLLGGLLDRPFGSGALIASAGDVVIETVNAEVEKIVEGGEMDDRPVTEFRRYVQLLSMDLKLVAAAKKDVTLVERCEQAKERCNGALQRADLLD